MINGVQLKQLTKYCDERGYFEEIIRSSDDFFSEGFGQWSHSFMFTGTIKAWHWHAKQTDWWFCPIGVIKAVLYDLRPINLETPYGSHNSKRDFGEFLLGENQLAQVLKIPPGVAHGLKVLQGPAHLFYVTSREYDPDDEGRIGWDKLGYDWDKREIK